MTVEEMARRAHARIETWINFEALHLQQSIYAAYVRLESQANKRYVLARNQVVIDRYKRNHKQ